ncbi:sucrose-phosphate phosphatase [Anthocerotibacter panamensis]|uniref:sucrose-phosphate phosphatase n=1 Tax=Anthocerotibacter panamensis TaxID=2857077 RepID=UPI001C407FE3|nr:sucrose-phosphate phosphatase [Anthocerotibacter panamensis]
MSLLLVLDLDDTLVGDDRATAQFNQWLMAQEDRVTLVYSTGRSWISAHTLQTEHKLLEPSFWVVAAGTEIYGQGRLDSCWAARLNTGWDRQEVLALAAQFPALTPQQQAEQRPWKVSFRLDKLLDAASHVEVSKRCPGSPTTLVALKDRLDRAGLSAQILYSSDRDVAILPLAGNKGNAVAYLREQLGFLPKYTIVCGGSGNDISFFSGPERGILVGNALPELRFWYLRHSQPRHYLACRLYAWGILEGLAHFRLAEPVIAP